MPHYPYTKLVSAEDVVVAIQGPCIRVMRASGEEVYSTVSDSSPTASHHPISCAALDDIGRKLVTVSEDKILNVWEVEGLKCLSSRVLPKKATDVCITSDRTAVLVADKFGDVFSYPMEARSIPPRPPKPSNSLEGRKSLVAHYNPSDGTLILGHASLLTAMALTQDEKYIITADRDEHIRVSHYPEGYDIERFCLGHTKYISAMHIPPSHPRLLVSGGGDRTLRVWEYLSGKQIAVLGVWDAVKPFLRAHSQRRKFKRGENWAGKGWRARRRAERERKEKGAQQQKQSMEISSARAESPDASMAMDLEEAEGSSIAQEDIPVPSTCAEENAKPSVEDVVVISRIVTLQEIDGFTIVFSVLGAAALFWVRLTGASLGRIQSYDTGKPVLDLTLARSPHQIWVTLDAEFGEEGDCCEPNAWVRLLSWDGMVMNRVFDSRLLDSLNRNTANATETDLENLNLYGDLTSLPKSEEDNSLEGSGLDKGETPGGSRDVSVPVAGEKQTLDVTGKKAKNMPNNPNGAKRVGREVWKGKMEQRQNAVTATIPNVTTAPEVGREVEKVEEEEPTAKRQRTIDPS